MGGPGPANATAAGSVALGGWTAVSRLTGFLRVAVIAAVLGPTFLGNTFQAVNLLPNITYYFLTGSLFVSLLVPALTAPIDRGDSHRAARIAGGFLGVALPVFAVIGVALVASGPWLLRLLTSGASESVAADQRRAGWLLLVFVMPQVLLYAVASAATAVLHARGRFGIAAAAPVFENVGIIATLVVYALAAGVRDVGVVSGPQLAILGVGATLAVALHAAVAWVAAWRSGVLLRPRAGWKDAEVRAVVRRAVPSLAYASATGTKEFALITLTNRIAGGVVAFGVAWNFYNLCIALSGRTVGPASVPALARLHQGRDPSAFNDELRRAAALASFLAVPAAVACLVLASPLAGSVAYGAMASDAAVGLIAAALGALALGIIADTFFTVATHASYARGDVGRPLRAMLVRVVTTLGVSVALVSIVSDGQAVMAAVGASVAVGDAVGATVLWMSVARGPARLRLRPSLVRTAGAAAVMIVPAWAVARAGSALFGTGELATTATAAPAVLTGAVLYLGVQRWWRSPELAAFAGAVRGRSA